jgi:hypothetical protein
VCVSLASTSFWFDYLTESPPQAAVPCRPPVRPELADTELGFFLSAFSVYCCKWLNKRLACRLGTDILHLLTMHISCIAHVRWFGQLPPRVEDDVISSIAVAVIAAHPPVSLSPHELSLTIYVHRIWRHMQCCLYISSMIWKWPTADPNTRHNLNPYDPVDVVRNPNTPITNRPRRWSESDILLTLTHDIT